MSEEEVEEDAALLAAHNVQGNRLSRPTEQQYRRYIEIFKVWVQESWAGGNEVLNAAGEFLLPMSLDLVESFLGHLATRRIPVHPARGVAVDPLMPVQLSRCACHTSLELFLPSFGIILRKALAFPRKWM